MVILHLATSPFFGGPERLILGLAQSLPTSCQSAFVLFADRDQDLFGEMHGCHLLSSLRVVELRRRLKAGAGSATC